MLLQDFRKRRPDVTVRADGRQETIPPATADLGPLDIALVRPPENPTSGRFLFLLHGTPSSRRLDRHPRIRESVTVADLAEQPLIVPERRSRPHSHDLTMKLFAEASLHARVVQLADEKQTIVNLVAAGLGVAIVPRWTSRMAARGVRYIPLAASDMNGLPLAAAWARGTRDLVRDEMLEMLSASLTRYAREA
jgi:DNA-binding transcriptional LysR family regulator